MIEFDFEIVIAVIAVVIVVLFSAGKVWFTSILKNKKLDEIAARFNAQVVRGPDNRSWFSFPHNDRHVYVLFDGAPSQSEPKIVQVQIPWIDSNTRLNVYPATIAERLKKFIGLEDIRIGSPDFDKKYIIQGNQQQLVELLTAEAQSMISRIVRMTSKDEGNFSIGGSNFQVRKYFAESDLDWTTYQYIRLCVELYDILSRQNGVGITFIDTPEVQSQVIDRSRIAICMVCGDEIYKDLIYCRSCQTPHHQECWEYIGMCSTYACGQRQFQKKLRSKRKTPFVISNKTAKQHIDSQKEYFRDRN